MASIDKRVAVTDSPGPVAEFAIRSQGGGFTLSPTDGHGRLTATQSGRLEFIGGRLRDSQIFHFTGRKKCQAFPEAGVGAAGSIADHTDDEWLRVFDINVLGLVRVSRAALPWLVESTAASVVNTGSIAATAGLPQRAIYSASKGAVTALTRAMAADHLADGIRVNCVNPGTADTPWVQRLLAAADDPAAERAALEARQPHGRLVDADEVAGAVLYLASPRSRSTTGTMIAVDGGMQDLRLRSKPAPA